MKDIPNNSIDMILADLPYGILSTESWDICLPFNRLWEQYLRIIRDDGTIALFGQEPFSSRLRLSNVRCYRYDWIWEKSQAGGVKLSHSRPLRSYETISIFYKKQAPYHPPLQSQDRFDGSKQFPRDILHFSNRRKKSYHPTQKPVRLLKYLIETYTEEREIVLDNTMGSGSTGVAALETNRNFIGYELNDRFFKIAQERLAVAASSDLPYQKPKLLDTSRTTFGKPRIPDWIFEL